ncbi:MAG: hypothetical protein EA397_11655 [Deltaproteobacteria bacterium]|nr:MAG: hypothetical protein EA397_11655 [Deltaproteobacteria bacterium]
MLRSIWSVPTLVGLLSSCVSLVASEPSREVERVPGDVGPSARHCVVSFGEDRLLDRPCLFTPDEPEGSFSLSLVDGSLIGSWNPIALTVRGPDQAEVWGMTARGIKSPFGVAVRSAEDPSCWQGAEVEICAHDLGMPPGVPPAVGVLTALNGGQAHWIVVLHTSESGVHQAEVRARAQQSGIPERALGTGLGCQTGLSGSKLGVHAEAEVLWTRFDSSKNAEAFARSFPGAKVFEARPSCEG